MNAEELDTDIRNIKAAGAIEKEFSSLKDMKIHRAQLEGRIGPVEVAMRIKRGRYHATMKKKLKFKSKSGT